MQGTHPFPGVEAVEEFVHQVGRESALRGLVLPAEPGAQGVGESSRIRIVGQFVLLSERKGQAFALEGFGKAEDRLVLGDAARRRDLPILIAQVALEPAVEVVSAAGHGEPALRTVDVVIGAVLETGHGVGGAKGFDKLDAAPGSEVGNGLGMGGLCGE